MEDLLIQAARLINTTSRHLFLTGKAGTGKTTFLKNLNEITHKSYIVVAPTGIAALQAGGVTIHSQFLLPPGTFLPDRFLPEQMADQGRVLTQHSLARKHPLNSARKLVLRSIDLLVIDEVSMLRADLLDAIDYRMKAARGNFRQSFGGAQVLFIGDLFQLPPVIRTDEQELLGQYYKSPWFYEAHALRSQPPVYLELQKIFRQTDAHFISLLNHLRNNEVTRDDINLLNRHFKSADEIRDLKEVITLTTHNYKADEINQRELRALSTPTHTFDAFIEGEFPENMYPALPSLQLKVGAQIMFIRNDPSEEKKYVNGKLATVLEMSGHEVWVALAESHERYPLKRARWENKRYSVETRSQEVTEEVIGVFEQFPVKLAWAITVHKSQGLTFDRAIIDVEQAFTGGQVYVALSRLRSLDGLILQSRVPATAITTDQQAVAFAKAHHQPDKLDQVVVSGQREYVQQLIHSTFDFSLLIRDILYLLKTYEPDPDTANSKPVLVHLAETLDNEKRNTEKFRQQLSVLLAEYPAGSFLERLHKGSAYYRTALTALLEQLLQHVEVMRSQKRVKSYVSHLTELDLALSKKMEEVDKAWMLASGILDGRHSFDMKALVQQRNETRAGALARAIAGAAPLLAGTRKKVKTGKRKSKKDEPSTYDITLDMLADGLTPIQIAEKRGLTLSTIESHLAKAIDAGRLTLDALVTTEEQTEIREGADSLPDGFGLKDVFDLLKGRYSYGKLRAVLKDRGAG